MPGSREQALTPVIEILRGCFPGKARRDKGLVFDVGCGFAKWGLLFREYLDLCYVGNDRSKWTHTIHGIDIYTPYLQRWYYEIYDAVFIGDFLQVINDGKGIVWPDMGEGLLPLQYDFIYLGDVLEHWDKKDGEKVLSGCAKRSKHTVISTPIRFKRQGTRLGNKYEDHLSVWSDRDFKVIGGRVGFKYIEVKQSGPLWIAKLSR